MGTGHVVMGLLFFPRGGSAQVTRYLAAALTDASWSVALAAGSLGDAGTSTHAPTFFAGVEVHPLDYSAAVRAFEEAGISAVAAPVPMHPSYEDRVGAPDPLLTSVEPELEGHLAGVWRAPSRRSLAERLGTTLRAMPEAVAAGAVDVTPLAAGDRLLLASTRWSQWRHGEHWAGRLREQAAAADHLVVVAPPDRATAVTTLGVSPDQITAIPNGVETDRFAPRVATPSTRRAQFRRWLVEDPQGWREGGEPGTVRYREADLDRLLGVDGGTTVLVFVGRFTNAKRVPLLLRAFARARQRASRPVSLVVWGGQPGELEDEHPVTVADEVGADGIFFTGWRGHDDLPDGLAACDALVMPSVDDSFAQTALEAMATGLPVLTTLSGGFPAMVNLDPAAPTGWLVPPDDLDALTDALVAVVDDPGDVRRRGANALAHARAELSWSGRVPAFAHVYDLARQHNARTAPGR